MMTLTEAAERINRHRDLTATIQQNRIAVEMYRRRAGYVTARDLETLSHTPTGWGNNLHKGRLQVWQSLVID